MSITRRAVLSAALAFLALPLRAQDGPYPNRPVRIIIPYPPGQSSDTMGRIVAEILSQRWPQRVFVENRGGGGGVIGMEAVKHAAPDGYTLSYVAIGPMNVMPAMVPNVPYDPIRDFRAIAIVSTPPVLLVVHPSFPAQTIREFVAYTRENQVDYASGGPGTVQHMAGELMRHQLGLKLNHVAYRGSGPAVTDTVAGVVKVMVDGITSALPHVRAGRLRAIALTAGDGVPFLPGVPSITNTISREYSVVGWGGLFAPAGVPEEIIRRANADVLAGMQDPALRARLDALGNISPPPWSPDEAQGFVNQQVHFWGRVIREAGLRIDG